MVKEKHGLIFNTTATIALLILSLQIGSGQTSNIPADKSKSEFRYLLIHPLHEVNAVCKDFSCTVEYNDATRTIVSTSFSAEVASFDSGNSNRDSHAMEVLDALTYPTVSFKSKQIKTSGESLQVSGDLTFHGVTNPISFEAIANSSDAGLTVKGKADVSLTSFKVERPSLLFIPVQDTLRISFAMTFTVGNRDSK